MKAILMTTMLMFGAAGMSIAQSEKFQSGDSIRVAIEREKISKELTQLRDSIQQSVITFDSRIKKAPKSKSAKLKTARQELLGYQGQVKLDLEEISQTSQNGWRKASVERIRTTMTATRRQHKRIRTML